MKGCTSINMIRYKLVFTVFFAMCLLISPVKAVEVKDLYVAKVKVASQSRSDRNSALKQALQLILVKVGGHKSVLSHPVIKAELKKYNRFVANYRYERNEDQQSLKASFDQTKINALFVEANLPIWGSLRPQVALWLVNEQGLIREVITKSLPPKQSASQPRVVNIHTSELATTVQKFSSNRGLPIVMPVMDNTDMDLITTSDVWGRFKNPIYHASKRYLAEAVVIIRISDNSLLSEQQINETRDCQLLCQRAISLDWSFIFTANNDETQRFSERYQGIDRNVLLNKALNDITDDIYQRYALTTNENNQFEIEVANVDSLHSYAKLKQFLQQLSSVQTVKLTSASGSKRRFSLTVLGSQQALLASLKLNTALKQYIDPLAPMLNNAVPVFYWEQL